ncbi:hypothetical protein BH23BAC1_BH23BAC1_26830 [soil metagenome]
MEIEAVIEHNVIMVIINEKIKKLNIYNATRFAWKIARIR